MGQPLKKKDVPRRNTIADIKAKMGFATGDAKTASMAASNADKPLDWLIMPKAYQDAIKLPGIPMGYVSTVCGHSNTGKSTLVNHIIVAAQKQGLVPVIYDTENNFDFKYAIDMGMQATPIWGDVNVEIVDPTTGEVTVKKEHRILQYEGNFFYFNNSLLAERYGKMDYSTGKETSKVRKVAVIEDIARSITEFLDMQDDGTINSGIVFCWDSVGSIDCWKSLKSSPNPMYNAASIATCFNTILNSRIPSSRKVSSPHTNTMVFINKVWVDSMSAPMAAPSLALKGGNAIFYASRLILLLGGQIKAATKKLIAETKGIKYNWAVQSKLKTIKNQLPAPFTVTYEGEVICGPHGMIETDKDAIEAYKKEHLSDILASIKDIGSKQGTDVQVSSADISFTEEEQDEE